MLQTILHRCKAVAFGNVGVSNVERHLQGKCIRTSSLRVFYKASPTASKGIRKGGFLFVSSVASGGAPTERNKEMKKTIERITGTAILSVAFMLCTTSAWAVAKPVAIWHRDFTADPRGGYGITANGNTVGTEYITLNGTSGGVIVKNTSVTQNLEDYPLGVVARFTGAVNSSSIRALATTITSATTAGSDRTWFGVNNSTQMQSYYNNGSPAAWTSNRNNYDTNHAWPNTGTHYFGCTYSAEDKNGSSGRFGWRSYVDGVLSVWNAGMVSYSTDRYLKGYGFALGGSTTGYQFTDATIDYIAIVRSAYPSDIAYWSLTDMTKTAATFVGSDANTGVNVPASGETISAATAAAAVFVQADATLGFSGSGSLTIGDGTGPLYIDSAATLTIDLNGVTAPTAESPFVLLVKGQVYGAAQVNFTNVPSDVITSIGEGGTIALLHNSVYTDLLASWKSNGQKVFAWRDATGNAFQSCNVSSVDTDTGTIKEATATTHSYSKSGGFNDENPAGVLYYDNPAYASSTSVNYSWFTLGGMFVTAGGSSLGNSDQQLKLGDNNSNSGKTFHYVFAQSFDLGPFKSNSKLYGPVDLTIYEGATVTLSANGLKLANDSGMVANLKMSGGGVLKTSGTITAESGSNGITLDYSALDVSCIEPFIQGNLSIHDNVNLVLPAALAANTPYQLCSGTLTVGSTSLQKSITVGSNTFLADLTFDTSAKTVSYCPARTTTVSGGTAEWSNLTWANGTGTAGWASGANAYITVSAASTISVGSATTVNKLKLLGSANLTITGIDNLTVGSFDLSDYTGKLNIAADNAATATTWKFTGSADVTVVSSAKLTLGTLDLSEYSGSMVVDGPTTSPVAAENALSITTSASLGSSASLTISHNALILANGVLTGAGTLYLDPGEGNSYTMSQSNTGYTGEAVIKSGTVKMGDATSFGNMGRDNYYIRVKGDATFDVNHHDATSNQYLSRKNQVVLEEGAKLTSSTAHDSEDTKLSGFQTIKLDGDAEVVADTTYVSLSLHYNYWPSRLELGTHTLTKTGANQLYLSICTITGTGMLDIEEGGVTIFNGYNGSLSTCENGTIRIGSGGRLDFSQYSSGAPTLSVKNLELYGSVTRVADSSTLTVTGYISGTGTTPMLTLADGATLKPQSSTGGLTVTSSLTLSGSINIDLSEIDLTGKSKLAIIKSPLQIDKDTQVATFTRGSNSEDWVLYSEEVSTGVYELGVKLNKTIESSISWSGSSGTWSANGFNAVEDSFYNDANQTVVFADDAGSSSDPLAVAVSGDKNVNALNFTADNRNVTLSGDAITAATVSKSGDGVAIVNNALSGITSISVTDGVLVLNPNGEAVADVDGLAAGTLVIYVGSGETRTVTESISAAKIVKRGAGALNVTAIDPFNISTTIDDGKVVIVSAPSAAFVVNGNGVLELTNTGSSKDDRTVTNFSNITGTGTIRYAGSGWRCFPNSNMFADTLSVQLEQGSGVPIPVNNIVVGSISGSKNLRTDLGGSGKTFTVKQANDGVWEGSFHGGWDGLEKFVVQGGDTTTGTLTLAGITTPDGSNTYNDKLEVANSGSVNLTGSWIGDTIVNGEFGGTGSITGALTLNAGSTFKVWATGGLTVTGALTLPASGTVAVDVSDLTIGAGDSTTLLTVGSGMPANINKFALDSATHMLSISGQTLSLVPIAATLTSNGVTTPYATVDQAVGFLASPLLPGDSYVTLVHGTTSDLTYTVEDLTAYNIVYNSANGRYVLAEAKIDTVLYPTIEAAIAAAGDGATVTLLKDVSLTDRLFVNAGTTPVYGGTNNRYATTSANNAITLDLNGHNITTASNIALAGGSLTITGSGTITTTNGGAAPVEIYGKGDLGNKRTLVIDEYVSLVGGTYGLNIFGSNNADVNKIDVTVKGSITGTLFVLGNLTNPANEINIVVNGTIAATASTGDDVNVGVALNGNANVTVNEGAIISGDSGIEVRAGSLTVNGGTITATAQTYSYKPNGSGSTTKGAAIAIAQHTTVVDLTATLSGGTLVGAKKVGITNVNGSMTGVTVQATSSYTKSAEIPAGYKWVETATPGVYTLEGTVGTTFTVY